MKTHLFFYFFAIFFISKINGQMPVTDVAANTQLKAIALQLKAMQTSLNSNKINTSKNLTESINQTKKLTKTLEILNKVSNALKTVNSAKNSAKYAYKIIEINYQIINYLNEHNKREVAIKLTDVIEPLIQDTNKIVKNIQNLFKDKAIKTDSGKRLDLIFQMENKLQEIYFKMLMIKNLVERYYGFKLVSPIKI